MLVAILGKLREGWTQIAKAHHWITNFGHMLGQGLPAEGKPATVIALLARPSPPFNLSINIEVGGKSWCFTSGTKYHLKSTITDVFLAVLGR